MSWRDRLVFHPLPDAAAIGLLTLAFAVTGTIFVRAQTGTYAFPAPCIEQGITDQQACIAYIEQFLVPFPTNTQPTTEPAPAPVEEVPEACRLKGILDPEQCRRYLESLSAPALPEPCVAAGVTTPEECKLIMEKLLAPAEPPSPDPMPVIEIPEACKRVGILTPEACKAYLEKLNSPPPPPPSDADSCAARCASIKEECYRNAGGDASRMDACSATAGTCYQACSAGGDGSQAGLSADACIKERCYPLTESCMAKTGDSPEALAACERVIGECASRCVKGAVQRLTAAECSKYTCSLVEGRCMAGKAGSFSQESIAAAGGHIPRCAQAGNDCRIRCAGGQIAARPETQVPTGDPGLGFDVDSFLPAPCREQGLTDPEECAGLMKSSFVSRFPKECQDAGITDPEDCHALFAERALLPECREKGATTQEECQAVIVARNLPQDCIEAEALDEESCRKLVQDAYLPKACREAGVIDDRACEKIIFDKYGRPDECAGLDDSACRRLIESGKVTDDLLERIEEGELPENCVAAGAGTFKECERLTRERTMPAECREAGIFSPEGCEKHLFEKYRKQGEEQFRAAMPAECREAGITEPEDCRKLMEAKFFPKECVEAGVTDPEGCKAYIQAKHMPEECKAQGLETREDCEALLRKKHLEPVCEAQGLTDPAACEEFVYAHLAEAVKCEGLEDAECALAIKGRHLGGILGAKDKLDRIGQRIEEFRSAAGTLDVDGSGPIPEGLREILPFEARGSRRLAVLGSRAQVALTDGDEIESTPPAVLAFDADGDGIPDDIELRQGLDPAVPDDKDDVEGELAPVEEAILAGGTLGQPVLEGEEDPALEVSGAETVLSDLVIDGGAPAGEIVTLYIYSPLPVVVTVTTGEDGRWSYDFTEALKDGEHRVYVAVNDSAGRVVRKSNPLSFFISEAVAATPEEFVAPRPVMPEADVMESSPVTQSFRWYLIGGGATLLIASSLAWVMMRGRKRGPSGP